MVQDVNYLAVGTNPWNQRIYEEFRLKLPGQWSFISKKKELDIKTIRTLSPQYIFFLHWSWIVPEEITDNFKCVCFHMTDVPYGRGGSPLQNLIIRGHRMTKLTALRMVKDMDAGPVYLKKDLSLEGSAEEIYMRSTRLSFEMIQQIISEEIKPLEQSGKPTVFPRRTPAESKIPKTDNIESLHDFIRMLDAKGYPKAYLEYEGFKFEFSRSCLYNDGIKADVTITRINQECKK